MKLFKERLLIVSKRCAKVIGLFTLVLLIGVIMSVVDSLLPSFFFYPVSSCVITDNHEWFLCSR